MSRASLFALTLLLVAPAAAPGQQGRALPGAPGDAPAFWQALGDPILERLVTEALRSNPELRAAGAHSQAARAERTSAALDLTPSLTAVGGYSRTQLSGAAMPGVGSALPRQDLWEAGLRLAWDVDVFGRQRQTLQGRSALVASADADAEDARVLVAAEVTRAYFELRGAEERLAVARRNAENQQGTLELTRTRLEAGQGTALDIERAQAQLSSTLASIPLLETTVAATRNRIGALTGRVPTQEELESAGDPIFLRLPDLRMEEAPEAAVLARPDVRSAERQVEARSALADAARSAYLPSVSIGGGAGYTAGAFDALGETGTPRYSLGAVISWPLVDLGRVRARVDAAQARETEAAAHYAQAVLHAREELRTALVAYENARERLQHLEDAAAASERATELARLRFEEGATGFLEVLDAERTQLDAQDRLAAGRSAAAAGLVAIYRALRGGWMSSGAGAE